MSFKRQGAVGINIYCTKKGGANIEGKRQQLLFLIKLRPAPQLAKLANF